MLGDLEPGVTVLRPLLVMPLPHLTNSHCLGSLLGGPLGDFHPHLGICHTNENLPLKNIQIKLSSHVNMSCKIPRFPSCIC